MNGPQSKEQRDAERVAWEAREAERKRTEVQLNNATGRFIPVYPTAPVAGEPLPRPEFLSAELQAGPSGWWTVPKFIRFAVWLMAWSVVLGFAFALVSLVFWLITAGAIISQM